MKIEQHDKPLRARVKLFGNLLGYVLKQQEAGKVYNTVEVLRRGFLSLHKNDNPDKRRRLNRVVEKLDVSTLSNVIRAFNIYFSLANIAEESYQHQIRRQTVRQGGPLWSGSFDAVLRELRDKDISHTQLQDLLNQLRYTPVITAHPTESKRRTIMEALRRIFVTAEKLDAPKLVKQDQDIITERLQSQIQALWKTDEVRASKLRVKDEVTNGLFYFSESLFKSTTTIYRNLEKRIEEIYGPDPDTNKPICVPSFLSFGSWIGGDRDGNPLVKPSTTKMAVRMQARTVLSEYLNRLRDLGHVLTFSRLLCTPSDKFDQDLEQQNELAVIAFPEKHDRFTMEPYRRKIGLMCYRLERNLIDVQTKLDSDTVQTEEPNLNLKYLSELELLQDLYLIRDSLISHGDEIVANQDLNDLIRLVESFGFYLAQIDVRQESTVHTNTIAELLSQQSEPIDYIALSETERINLLSSYVDQNKNLDINKNALSEKTLETLEVFEVMVEMKKEISPDVFGTYIISMTHNASHILEVLFLATSAGLVRHEDHKQICDIRIGPLFETIEDLNHIEPVMSTLFDNPVYRNLLSISGDTQEVMVGYSDSCKDGGILSAAWSLYKAQLRIVELCAGKNINVRLFHGRGGTIGRGGGPTHEAILSQPPGTVHGKIKFTEQGEVLSSKYSNAETAVYELTLGVTGLMKSSVHRVIPNENTVEHYSNLMQFLAGLSETSYRQLTDHTPGFLDYFYEVTPVSEIGLLNIGSRPSHRKKGDRSKSSVRAISWVFGWAQARHTLPAWFGVGSALQEWCDQNPQNIDELHKMYQEWPFFRSLLSNIQMALYKADMEIAKTYADLVQDPTTGQQVFQIIKNEYNMTVDIVLKITGISVLLQENPSLMLSLQRRNPYLDPLSNIQITLLNRYRNESLNEEERNKWLSPLLRTINAIAAGMRNTG